MCSHSSIKSKMSRTLLFAAGLGFFSLTSHGAALFTPLKDVSNNSYYANSEAYDVNADGTVVVGIGTSTQAFIWTEASGMVGLGKLPGKNYSIGLGVSTDGSVIVGNNKTSQSSASNYGYLWTSSGGMQAFSSQPLDSVNDVSSDGSVVAGRDYTLRHAYRWTQGGGKTDLGVTVPGSYSHSEAMAVSDDGSTVVGVSYSNDLAGQPRTGEAFIWNASGGMVGLGDFTGGYNISLSQANAVSADNAFVVGRGEDASGYAAFRWSAATGLQNLGVLPAANYYSEAYGVSGDGAIVVGTSGLYGDTAAFIWDAVNGMRNLKTVLETDYALSLTGWTLKAATRISADGNVIVGYGTNPQGRREAWRVILQTAPKPDVDMAITGSGPAVFNKGDTATFNYTITNNTVGASAKTAALNVDFPTGTQVTSATPSIGQCQPSGRTVHCALGDLAPGNSVTIAVNITASNTGAASALATAAAYGNELTSQDNQLTQSYTVQGIPVVSILSPTAGATILLGDPVSLQATATDNEDGDVSASVQWSSSLDGALGTGGLVSISTLSAGQHLITATATDSTAATGSANVSITITSVVNTPPTISISSPTNNAVYLSTDSVLLQASASDTEDGDLSASVVWSSSVSGALGTGNNLSVSLPAGTHVITAQVTDSGGETSSTTVTVTVNAATVSYCSASGSNANYEWINTIKVGAYSNTSGKNYGYGNFTSGSSIALARGSNSITLTPGFSSGSYTEYWGMWIDFNHDGVFSTDERVYSLSSSSTLYGSISVPATALAGDTRMRIVMRWGNTPSACGSFTYGEVEDYTVNIAP